MRRLEDEIKTTSSVGGLNGHFREDGSKRRYNTLPEPIHDIETLQKVFLEEVDRGNKRFGKESRTVVRTKTNSRTARSILSLPDHPVTKHLEVAYQLPLVDKPQEDAEWILTLGKNGIDRRISPYSSQTVFANLKSTERPSQQYIIDRVKEKTADGITFYTKLKPEDEDELLELWQTSFPTWDKAGMQQLRLDLEEQEQYDPKERGKWVVFARDIHNDNAIVGGLMTDGLQMGSTFLGESTEWKAKKKGIIATLGAIMNTMVVKDRGPKNLLKYGEFNLRSKAYYAANSAGFSVPERPALTDSQGLQVGEVHQIMEGNVEIIDEVGSEGYYPSFIVMHLDDEGLKTYNNDSTQEVLKVVHGRREQKNARTIFTASQRT